MGKYSGGIYWCFLGEGSGEFIGVFWVKVVDDFFDVFWGKDSGRLVKNHRRGWFVLFFLVFQDL